jgi:hypothetical protein
MKMSEEVWWKNIIISYFLGLLNVIGLKNNNFGEFKFLIIIQNLRNLKNYLKVKKLQKSHPLFFYQLLPSRAIHAAIISIFSFPFADRKLKKASFTSSFEKAKNSRRNNNIYSIIITFH